MNGGSQGLSQNITTQAHGVWAVHSGDVSAIPLPASVMLFCTGLFGLMGFVRLSKY